MASPGKHDPAFTSAMRDISRSHMASIWQRGERGEPLAGEDDAFYQAMKLHPEYRDIWEHAEQLGDRDVTVKGVNPFLHISMHSVIERQIADRTPPETGQTLFRLMQAGMDRHEAVHMVASVLSEHLWEMLHDHKPYDNEKYCRRLRALKP